MIAVEALKLNGEQPYQAGELIVMPPNTAAQGSPRPPFMKVCDNHSLVSSL